ncbi:hypothetical protein ACLOJK_029121 [Asimina triloba]
MSAEESETVNTSFLERLIGGSRNRDISLFFPVILGVMGPPRRDDAQQSSSEGGQGSGSERIVLINPFTQGMIIIDGGGVNLEALMRGLSEMESGKGGPPPASKASIKAMPAVQVSEEGAECAICLEGMEVGEEAKEMPCKHRYHGECIGKWLGLHGSCPVCRYRMPLEEEEVKKGEGERGAEGRRDGEIWVRFSFGTRDSTSSSTPPQAEQPDTLPNNLED